MAATGSEAGSARLVGSTGASTKLEEEAASALGFVAGTTHPRGNGLVRGASVHFVMREVNEATVARREDVSLALRGSRVTVTQPSGAGEDTARSSVTSVDVILQRPQQCLEPLLSRSIRSHAQPLIWIFELTVLIDTLPCCPRSRTLEGRDWSLATLRRLLLPCCG